MERRVSVNDHSDVEEFNTSAESSESAPDISHGPCLYLGKSGERCGHPAIEGGYCAKHHPDEEKRWPGRSYSRVLVASAALFMILWPYIADTARLLVHLVHALYH
jgi:Family of unknown function (DUF5763)